MEITLTIPDQIATQLLQDSDPPFSRRILELVAIAGYKTERLSLGEVAEMLGISTFEADDFLKDQGVSLNYTISDLENDRETIATLFNGQ